MGFPFSAKMLSSPSSSPLQVEAWGVDVPLLEPISRLLVQILQGGSNQYGLMHLNFCKLVAEAKAMGQFPGLPWMSRNMGLKMLNISLPEEMVQLTVKTGITLL
jgi:hypothetical protein